jgi:hypothetical protein
MQSMTENNFQEELKVVRGNPTAEELAAVIAIVEAAAAEESSIRGAIRQPKSTWNRNQVNLRGGINPGFGQWTASYRDGLN